MSRKMDVSALASIVSRQITQATGEYTSEIADKRAELFDRYLGEPYGDEVENRSSVVSRDIADTIEWIMPELMEIFTSGDRIVSFDPLGPDDEAKAEQETDVVNHVFMRQNNGFLVLYSFLKDGLLLKNGYVKRWWDERETVSVEEYSGLTLEELAQMEITWAQDGAQVEYLEQSVDETTGEYSIRVRLTMREERLRVEAVPPDEVLVAARWNNVFLSRAPFVAHKRTMTVSDLIEQGYERKQVEALPSADDEEIGQERTNRFDVRGSAEYDQNEAADLSMREVIVHECYLRVDYDGDGVAELRKVTVGGTGHEILRWEDGGDDNEEVSAVPFSAWTPIIIPHRHFGLSVAELVEDLARIKTVLQRQLLDNIYLTNNPTREIAEGGIIEGQTIQDLLVDRPGKIVRTALPGHYAEHSPPQFMGQMLPAIEYIDAVKENRTGVTRYNQGLDANSLNKTASGVRSIMSAAQKKIALIARIAAETGVTDLFRGIHDDLRRNATKAMTIKLRGQYIPVDPRHWRSRSDLDVNVALGTGDREAMVARLMMIAEKQEQHLLNGSPLVGLDNLHHTYSQIIEKSGFKNVNAFFRDPAQNPAQPMAPQQQGGGAEQAYMQAEQMKAQQRAQEAQTKAQLDMMRLRMEDDRERDRLNMEMGMRLMELNAKNQTALTIEQVRAAAAGAARMNQPEGDA